MEAVASWKPAYPAGLFAVFWPPPVVCENTRCLLVGNLPLRSLVATSNRWVLRVLGALGVLESCAGGKPFTVVSCEAGRQTNRWREGDGEGRRWRKLLSGKLALA